VITQSLKVLQKSSGLFKHSFKNEFVFFFYQERQIQC